MTLPSFVELSQIAGKTIRRFPLPFVFVYCVTIMAVISNHSQNELYFPYILTGIFAVPFTGAVDVFMESKKFRESSKYFARFLVLALVAAAYYYVFREMKVWMFNDIARFVLLFGAAGVLPLFAPFICRGKANAFWQFSIALVIRAFQTLVFFGILYIGMALLLVSIDYLFEVRIDEEYYFDVFLVIKGIFASMFFLAGVPSNLQRLEQTLAYPKFLRILTEYFLVPLVYLYMLVLYAYSAKILFSREWPLGGVASWIIGFSTVGTIAYFFTYSAKERFLPYVELFKKWYFIFLMPLMLVLGLSIGMRIRDYGLTENRYFVVAFGVWLLVMAVYYVVTRNKSLKFIPISLFLILSMSIYGPQSAFELSKASQLGRLEVLLINNNILMDGKVQKVEISTVNAWQLAEIQSITRYLVEHHGVEILQPWFSENLVPVDNQSNSYWRATDNILYLMGLGLKNDPIEYDEGNFYSFYVDPNCGPVPVTESNPVACPVNVNGYGNYLPFGVAESSEPIKFFLAGQAYRLELVNAQYLKLIEVASGAEIFSHNLKDFAEFLSAKYPQPERAQVPATEMTFEFLGGQLRVSDFNVIFKDNIFEKADYLYGEILFK